MRAMKCEGKCENGDLFFQNFYVHKASDNYFSVRDRYNREITSAKTRKAAFKKAKLLQIGYAYGEKENVKSSIEEYYDWYDY